MPQINLKFDFANIPSKFKKNASLVFYLILAVIIGLEIFSVSAAVSKFAQARKAPEVLIPSKGVRLNFAEYEAAAKKVEAGKNFLPGSPIFENPFFSQ